jgi:hypothetical protein
MNRSHDRAMGMIGSSVNGRGMLEWAVRLVIATTTSLLVLFAPAVARAQDCAGVWNPYISLLGRRLAVNWPS